MERQLLEVEVKMLKAKVKELESSNRNWRRKCQRLRAKIKELQGCENPIEYMMLGEYVYRRDNYENR